MVTALPSTKEAIAQLAAKEAISHLATSATLQPPRVFKPTQSVFVEFLLIAARAGRVQWPSSLTIVVL